jgi:ketosteroid isomerase-like protein
MSDGGDERLEVVRAVYARWGRGEFGSGIEPYDDGTDLVLRAEFPDAGTYRGRARISKYMRELLSPWERLVIVATEFRPYGDSVLVRVVQRGTGVASGVATEFAYFMVWTFEGDRATRVESIVDESEAVAAAEEAGERVG